VDIVIGDGHRETRSPVWGYHIPIPHTDGQGHSPSGEFGETIAEIR